MSRRTGRIATTRSTCYRTSLRLTGTSAGDRRSHLADDADAHLPVLGFWQAADRLVHGESESRDRGGERDLRRLRLLGPGWHYRLIRLGFRGFNGRKRGCDIPLIPDVQHI